MVERDLLERCEPVAHRRGGAMDFVGPADDEQGQRPSVRANEVCQRARSAPRADPRVPGQSPARLPLCSRIVSHRQRAHSSRTPFYLDPGCQPGPRRGRRPDFLDPASVIPRTSILVRDAREGNFVGSEIPHDLRRQWIQGTGPATKPRAPTASGLRNVAYALLSGADGWMFDGEDALGEVQTMSLDNQRNLKLAFAREPIFQTVAEEIAGEMNRWAGGFFGRPIIDDWRKLLDFTTRIFRARGLHLDHRHIRAGDGPGFSASIVDLVLYVVN